MGDEVIVADTHAWLWYYLDRAKLSAKAQDALSRNAFAISAISLWEVALLSERGRIVLGRAVEAFFRASVEDSGIELLPITPAVALRAAARDLDVLRDPADRLIVATALTTGAQLVTKDERIHRANVVAAIW